MKAGDLECCLSKDRPSYSRIEDIILPHQGAFHPTIKETLNGIAWALSCRQAALSSLEATFLSIASIAFILVGFVR